MENNKAHEQIEADTIKAIKAINAISKNQTPEAMLKIVSAASEWHRLYGAYWKTLSEATQASSAETLRNTNSVCKKCFSTVEKALDGTPPHKAKIVCANGHFKRWG